MILWILLAVCVVALSVVLAIKSMRDYQQISQSGSRLFLIRHSKELAKQLNSIHADLLRSNLSLSLERLFKGNQSALAVFGPTQILTKYKNSLDLLELEDYTNVNEEISAWEVGIKESGFLSLARDRQKIFGNLPKFADTEQFWWQVIVWVPSGQPMLKFQCQIRAVLLTADSERRKQLTQTLQNLASVSNAQLIDFKKRSWQKVDNPALNSAQLLQLILI